MADFFKKIGDDINKMTEQAEIDATVNRELAASIAEIEDQAEEEVNITEADPGLEIADAGKRPEEMRTQEEIRDYNRRVIEVNNAIKERNLAEGNKPTLSPEDGKKKGAYGKRRRRKRKYGRKKKKKAGKKKKKAGKKKRKTGIVKGVKGAAKRVKGAAKRVGKGATRTAKKVGRGANKIVKRVSRGADRIAKGLRSIFTQKRSFGRSTTPMPMYLEDYEQIQGYDPRELVMKSLFGKRKRKFGDKKDGCGCGFGKKRVYRFGKKCTSQCTGCGTITGFDPMAIVQKKLSYGKRRRKKRKFGKKTSKKPSAATRKMCKRLKVRMTIKRGGKRVYKSEKMLKKQCKTAMKRKKKKTVKRRKRKVKRRKRRFGMAYEDDEDEHYRRVVAEFKRYFPESRDVDILQLLISSPRHHDTIIKEINKAKEKEKLLEEMKQYGYGLKYGKRRRKRKKSSFGKKAKKPSAALKKLCKKHKVRLTVKRGKKRVYKSEKMLKKQCKTAMKRKKKKTVKRKSRYGHAFGRKKSKKLTAYQKFSKWCNNNEVACTAALTPLAVGVPMGMTHAYNKYYVEPYNRKQSLNNFQRLQRNTHYYIPGMRNNN
jgi:hypothetical protein